MLREAINIIRELFGGGGGTGLVFSRPKVTAGTTATSIAAANLRKAHR
jgi:hypothetical protein